MINLRAGTRILIAAGVTDMRRGFPGLSAQVQMILMQQPFSLIPWKLTRFHTSIDLIMKH